MTRNHVEDPGNRDDRSENEFEGKEICANIKWERPLWQTLRDF
jgi:hypothetical protein